MFTHCVGKNIPGDTKTFQYNYLQMLCAANQCFRQRNFGPGLPQFTRDWRSAKLLAMCVVAVCMQVGGFAAPQACVRFIVTRPRTTAPLYNVSPSGQWWFRRLTVRRFLSKRKKSRNDKIRYVKLEEPILVITANQIQNARFALNLRIIVRTYSIVINI